MAEYNGPVDKCPACGAEADWTLNDWTTYKSLLCKTCGGKYGEVMRSQQETTAVRKEGEHQAVYRLLEKLDGAPADLTEQILFDFCRDYGENPSIEDEKWSRRGDAMPSGAWWGMTPG